MSARSFAGRKQRWPFHAVTSREPLKASAKLLLFAPLIDSRLKPGMSETFDYMVIGGGSGGIASAVRACAIKLVTLGDDERVIGCHAVGAGVDEMMQGFAVAMRMDAIKKDSDGTIAIHSTTSEELVTLR